MTYLDIASELKQVKQGLFDEMVEGNGRQPAECADVVFYHLIDIFPEFADEFRQAINFYPEY